MGAALLTNPDLLCAILTALRMDLPPEISVSAKIRLLPTQADTLKLVQRIVATGVSAITVHVGREHAAPGKGVDRTHAGDCRVCGGLRRRYCSDRERRLSRI